MGRHICQSPSTRRSCCLWMRNSPHMLERWGGAGGEHVMSVWGLGCHARGWGHQPARRCSHQLPSGRVCELHPPPILRGPPGRGRWQAMVGEGGCVTEPLAKSGGCPFSPRLSAAPAGCSAHFCNERRGAQRSLRRQRPTKRRINRCLRTRTGDRSGGAGGSRLVPYSAKIHTRTPPPCQPPLFLPGQRWGGVSPPLPPQV